MGQRGRPRHPDLLTPREQEVLALLRDNLTNEQIAERLGISFETAKHHVAQVLAKLNVPTRQAAVAWYREKRRAWWLALPPWALAGAAAAVLVALAVLAWGVLRSSDGEGETAAELTPTTSIGSTPARQPTTAGTVAMAAGSLAGGLYRIGADGTGVTPIATPADPADGAHSAYVYFSVSDDGHWLAFAPRTPYNSRSAESIHVFLQDLTDSSGPVDLASFGQVGSIAVSTRGRILVSGSIGTPADPSTLSATTYLVDAGSVTEVRWLQDSYGATWSPDGTLIAAPANAGGDFDLKVGDPLGTSIRTYNLSYGPFAWSPDGSSIAVAAFTGSNVGVSILDLQDGGVVQLNDIQSDMSSRISWSPDGSRVAFADGKISIASTDASNSSPEQLGDGTNPVWSHDGTHIAYTRDGSLYTTDVSERSELKLGEFAQPLVGRAEWLPDDSGLLFHYDPAFLRSIRLSNTEGNDERHLAYGDDPVWSPDGTMIAFIGRVVSYGLVGRSFVYVMNSDGSDPHEVGRLYSVSDVVVCIGGGLSWSSDSSAVIYYHPGLAEVQSAPANGSAPPKAISKECPNAPLPSVIYPYPRMAPDGQRKLFLEPSY